jgi:hypothetical protein
MIATLKRQGKADEYRDRARDASAAAEAATLQAVRERHEAAAVKWLELAIQSEQGAGERRPAAAAPAQHP